jgi:hypothetical protein
MQTRKFLSYKLRTYFQRVLQTFCFPRSNALSALSIVRSRKFEFDVDAELFKDVLGRTRNSLNTLELVRCIPDYFYSESEPIHFPKLQRLTIDHCGMKATTGFMRYFSIPRTTTQLEILIEPEITLEQDTLLRDLTKVIPEFVDLSDLRAISLQEKRSKTKLTMSTSASQANQQLKLCAAVKYIAPERIKVTIEEGWYSSRMVMRIIAEELIPLRITKLSLDIESSVDSSAHHAWIQRWLDSLHNDHTIHCESFDEKEEDIASVSEDFRYSGELQVKIHVTKEDISLLDKLRAFIND